MIQPGQPQPPRKPLTRDTFLQRIPDLRLRLRSNNQVRLDWEGNFGDFGHHTLLILDAFATPRRLGDALSTLGGRVQGTVDWALLADTILRLHQYGVLRDADAGEPVLRLGSRGFDSSLTHVRILNDRKRTERYLAALRSIIQPSDVVLDLGTGTGILATAAAQLGARHVYAIEGSAMADVARRVFEVNHVSDRVTLLHGWSSQLELPERANVLVSEIIGNDPLNEGVLEFTRDALQRLVEPGARLIPSDLSLFALPLTVPEEELGGLTPTESTLTAWRDWYGVDLAPLLDAARGRPQPRFVAPQWVRAWPRLCEPVTLATIALREPKEVGRSRQVATVATTAGVINAVLLYFELSLAPSVSLSLHPDSADDDCSWNLPLCLQVPALRIERGTPMLLTYGFAPAAHCQIEVAP